MIQTIKYSGVYHDVEELAPSVWRIYPAVKGPTRKTLKRKYKQMCNGCIAAVNPHNEPLITTTAYSLGCCTMFDSPKKETSIMYNDVMEHLKTRASRIHGKKYEELERKFFITVDAPKTSVEAVERIKAGKYTLPAKGAYDDGLFSISWRAADQTADHEGFREASKLLDDAYQTAKDRIIALEPAEGLKALEEFKAYPTA